ncbi:MAG: hypothetical protein IKH34_07940 [Oscillospiraceae bacterium]|nr:hypothetical protein [Oscillospiraceae bacterium]MBR3474979.1 hypothetical protein [Oscillospiraceae bacterium]
MNKRVISLMLALMLVCSLCACGTSNDTGDLEAEVLSSETVPGYQAMELDFPDWFREGQSTGWDTCGDNFWMTGETEDGAPVLVSYDTLIGQWQRYDLDTADARNPWCGNLTVTEDAFWILINEQTSWEDASSGKFLENLGHYILWGSREDGEMRCTRIPFEGSSSNNETSSMSLLGLDREKALLTTPETCYLIDPKLSVLDQPNVSDLGGLPRFRVNDQLYLMTEEGAAPLDLETFQLGQAFELNASHVYSSNDGHFLYDKQNRLIEVNPATGNETERFDWMDVALSYSSMGSPFGLENSKGELFYITSNGLVKVSPAMVPVKKVLTLACFGDTGAESYEYFQQAGAPPYSMSLKLRDSIIRFNNSDPEYRIEIQPLLYNNESERDRLLIELATSEDIDILDTSFLPDGALDAGLLADMLPMIDADETISREDFIPSLLQAMMKHGGLYEYTDKFTLVTLLARPEMFPGRESWTVNQIEELIAQHPEYAPLWQSMNREMIVTVVSWAATAEFIDWENACCSFDSRAFQDWLRLLKELLDDKSPQDEEKLMAFCYDFASDAGFSSRYPFQSDYAVAGFPSTEGTGSFLLKLGSSAGESRSTVGQNTRIGIMASSKHQEGAWRFVRTLMMSESEEDQSISFGIPASRERFERVIDSSLSNNGEFQGLAMFNADDAQRLREQVYGATKLIHTDKQILLVMQSEINAFLDGQKSAEEAAKQIQSRLSLYLAEQYS